ncbi:MAG: hypothetical protein WKF35_06330 [Ferruginibacter sp.]
MKISTKKIILLSAAILFVAVFIIGYYLYNKGPVDVKNQEGIEATPNELYTFYVKDSVAAHQKYDDKVLRITGEITEITQNALNQPVILLKTSSTGGNINCTMDEPVKGLSKGNVVTIKGVCNGIGQGDDELGIPGDVYLTRSIIAD